ncbi:MAG: polysaccharide deacetylase family protein [Akkermansia sp.]|nr:polysaccharide deacetylase family protein [Akkermansia sp.]MBR2314515.1 polysaccharide deacetylase family protein [Akkermansia sp.]
MVHFRFWLSVLALTAAPMAALAEMPAAAAVTQPAGAPQEIHPMQVAVLGYGAFADTEGKPGITSTTFLSQMTYLKEQGITPVSLQQFVDWKAGKASLPERSVLITLDEADAAAYAVAYPVLRQFGFPCVVFVDGRNFRGEASSLGLPQLYEMQQHGAAIGSRSLNRLLPCDWQYAELAGPDAAQKTAERELGVSAQRIVSNFGVCQAFAYPRGYADANMVEYLAIYGYKVAFGMREGKVQQDAADFTLNRYMVTDMQAFARAVNFGAASDDELVLQRVRSVAAGNNPAPEPAAVKPADGTPGVFPTLVGNAAAEAAIQPPLPPVVDPVMGMAADAAESSSAPIPLPEVGEIKDPVLLPRPVSSVPAVGPLVRRSVGGDWVTREFPRPVVPREQTRIAVLGYHDFSNTRKVTDMCMRTAEFCQQMQYIKDSGLTVITMQDFLEWLLGNRCLPERCVLITIDDGWKSVYTDAFPVLKEYGFPFTLYLYTGFLGGHGRSMTPEMIREMQECGASVGSHSASHLYPSQWKRYAADSPEYAAQLQREIPDSVAKLKEKFTNCSTYCYPGGYHTEQMVECLRANGIGAAFTVIEKKVTSLADPLLVHRYMVMGNDPRVFRRAVNFDDVPGVKPTAQGITEARERAKAFFPKAFEGLGSAPPPATPRAAAPVPLAPMPSPPPAPEVKSALEDIPEPSYTSPEN